MDGVGQHPKVFFVSLSLFDINCNYIFAGNHRVGIPLPKFVAVGSDTKARVYVKNTLKEIVNISKNIYQVSNVGHIAAISSDPVLISGDGLLRPMFTGGPYPSDQACCIFDVSNLFFFKLSIYFITILHTFNTYTEYCT